MTSVLMMQRSEDGPREADAVLLEDGMEDEYDMLSNVDEEQMSALGEGGGKVSVSDIDMAGSAMGEDIEDDRVSGPDLDADVDVDVDTAAGMDGDGEEDSGYLDVVVTSAGDDASEGTVTGAAEASAIGEHLEGSHSPEKPNEVDMKSEEDRVDSGGHKATTPSDERGADNDNENQAEEIDPADTTDSALALVTEGAVSSRTASGDTGNEDITSASLAAPLVSELTHEDGRQDDIAPQEQDDSATGKGVGDAVAVDVSPVSGDAVAVDMSTMAQKETNKEIEQAEAGEINQTAIDLPLDEVEAPAILLSHLDTIHTLFKDADPNGENLASKILLEHRNDLYNQPIYIFLGELENLLLTNEIGVHELVITIPALDLSITSDNTYAKDISIRDIDEVYTAFQKHLSPGRTHPLTMHLSQQTRFITRFNELVENAEAVYEDNRSGHAAAEESNEVRPAEQTAQDADDTAYAAAASVEGQIADNIPASDEGLSLVRKDSQGPSLSRPDSPKASIAAEVSEETRNGAPGPDASQDQLEDRDRYTPAVGPDGEISTMLDPAPGQERSLGALNNDSPLAKRPGEDNKSERSTTDPSARETEVNPVASKTEDKPAGDIVAEEKTAEDTVPNHVAPSSEPGQTAALSGHGNRPSNGSGVSRSPSAEPEQPALDAEEAQMYRDAMAAPPTPSGGSKRRPSTDIDGLPNGDFQQLPPAGAVIPAGIHKRSKRE